MATNDTKIVISADHQQALKAFDELAVKALDFKSVLASLPTVASAFVGVKVVDKLIEMTKAAVDSRVAMKEMAEKTGATVETLSALSRVARIGGKDISIVENSMIRLTKALAGSDDEAKGAAHALSVLGLKANELQQMDQGKALKLIADQMALFRDGAGKSALAMDIFGKSGAQVLPFLRDLAEQGDLVSRMTTKQAEEADRLEKQWRKMEFAAAGLGRAIADEIVPAMNTMLRNMNAAKDAGFGWLQSFTGIGVRGLGESVADAKKNAGSRINDLIAERSKLQDELSAGVDQAGAAGDAAYTRLKEIEKQLMYYRSLQVEAVMEQYKPYGKDEGKPLNYKSRLDKKKPEGMSEEERARQRILELGQKNIMDQYYETGGEETMRLVAEKRNMEAAKEDMRASEALQRLRDKYIDMADPLQKYRDMLDEVVMLQQRGALTADQATEATWHINEAMDEAAKKMEGVKETGKDVFDELKRAVEGWGDKFADTIASIATGTKVTVGDMLRSIEADILRIQARAAIQPLLQNVQGMIGSAGGGLGSIFGGGSSGMLGSLFGSSGSVGGGNYFDPNLWTLAPAFHGGGIAGGAATSSRQVPNWVFDMAPRYHSGGIAGLAPDEVPAVLRRGERVIANGAAGGGPVHITINMPAGTSRASAGQVAAEAGGAVQRALRRNG
jgi:hypothetical protein